MGSSELLVSDIGMGASMYGLKQRGYYPNMIYDIGAADGAWAKFAMQVFPSSNIICFEPLEERRHILEELQVSSNGRVKYLDYGVGDENVDMSIGISRELYDSSFSYSGQSYRMVTVRTLDSLVESEGLDFPSFIKIDVQGFEKRVIDGGPSAFKHADLVLMECQFIPFCQDMRSLDETIAHMSSIGFVPYEFVDFLRRPLDGAMGQCDIMFVKKGHSLISNISWA